MSNMSNYFHKACIRVFAKEGEDYDKVKETLISFFPFNLEEEKVKIKQHIMGGSQEKEMRTYEICIEKNKHLNIFFEQLLNNIGSQKEILIKQKESRLDEDQKFYIRFDKDKLIKKDEYKITDSGNCFHITLSIASFPAKRETALVIIDKIFK